MSHHYVRRKIVSAIDSAWFYCPKINLQVDLKAKLKRPKKGLKSFQNVEYLNIGLIFLNGTFPYVFMYLFLLMQAVFKRAYLRDLFELETLPHHSSDVFFHGELIFDGFRSVRALHASISRTQLIAKVFQGGLSQGLSQGGLGWSSLTEVREKILQHRGSFP